MGEHKHKFTEWNNMDTRSILYFRLCKCGKIELKGDLANFNKYYGKKPTKE